MELSIRDWMMVIGVLLFLAVALDGYRRARLERRNQVRLSKNAKRAKATASANDDEEIEAPKEREFTSELPNGGARIVDSRADTIDPLNPPPVASERKDFQTQSAVPASVTEKVKAKAEAAAKRQAEEDEPEVIKAERNDESYQVDPLFADPFDAPSTPVEEKTGHTEKAETAEPVIKAEKPKKERREEHQPSLFDQPEKDNADPEHIIVLNVLAADKEGFSGEELLHILLACDCRFGEMNIFHRYEDKDAGGEIQFSIVNSVEPGVFNLDDIKQFSTPGVSFFMRLPGPEDPIVAFECMVETAQCLVKNLNGILRDDMHSTATDQTIEHLRQQIKDYMQRRLISA